MDRQIDRLSVCIETLFPQKLPYQERIRICARLGFSAYEFWYHDLVKDWEKGWIPRENAKDPAVLERLNRELGMKLVTFALNAAHCDHGGNLADRRGTEQMVRRLDALIPVAQRLGVGRLITIAGYAVPGEERAVTLKRAAAALKKMDRMLEGTGVILILEPLSVSRYGGFLLPTVKDVGDLLRKVGGRNLKMLFDLYHVQVQTGNILATMREYIDLIGHIHISGVPGQHEPLNSELNLPLILNKLAVMGYAGYYGLEYYPLKEPVFSLEETIGYLRGVGGFAG